MSRLVARVIKGMFHSIGFQLERMPPGNPFDFAPRPEDRDRWIRGLGIRTVLDVGAHNGESAQQFRSMLPEAMIYSFEPLHDCFARLEQALAGKDRHRAYNLALGDTPARTEIYRSDYSASSSLLPMAELHKRTYPFSAGSTREDIEVETLDRLAPYLDLELPILLKIDTQGFEKQVLIGAEATLSKIKLLIVETSFGELYQGQSRFPEIYGMLEAAGFEYRGSWDQFLSPRDGTPLQQDAIFLRPDP